jgi:hypothetical protein
MRGKYRMGIIIRVTRRLEKIAQFLEIEAKTVAKPNKAKISSSSSI